MRRPSLRQWPLRRMLMSVFGVSATVLLVIVVIVTSALVRLDHARTDRVERYGPALLATESLAKAYSDQETGVRGFVSSGDESFLDPYTRGLTVERRQEKVVRRLLVGEPELRSLLDDVVSAARLWQREVADPAIARARASGQPDRSQADLEAGKVRFDALRKALADLERPVTARRDLASRQLDHSLLLLAIVLAVALALLLLLGLITWQALRRWVTDPLRQLGAEAGVVEAGDLSHPVQVDWAPAEIRILSEQVDRMRLRIVREFALAEQARVDAQAARAQVEEQALDLQRSNTELEQFAYVASHDLQEPLRKVASFCQLLERRYKGQLDERGDQYIDFAVDGAKRMQQLVNDLLAFSRVGRLTSDFTAVDLGDALGQARRQLSATLEDAGASVDHDDLPTVQGDGTLLVQLFQNLVGNAVKFHGDHPPVVHIGARRDGDVWELSCSDNGIGIDPQYADKIFVIFQRLHGRDAYGGTGIGLAMCKKIVEYHGGRMWLDTGGTGGATFRWTLPVAQETGGTAPPGTTTPDNERTTHDAVSAGQSD